MIPAGQRRHHLEILKPSTERDSRGRKVVGWALVDDARAKIESLSGDEREIANQLAANATHRITIRYRRQFELTTKHAFRFRGRIINIGHVDNVGQMNVDWVCLCSEERS